MTSTQVSPVKLGRVLTDSCRFIGFFSRPIVTYAVVAIAAEWLFHLLKSGITAQLFLGVWTIFGLLLSALLHCGFVVFLGSLNSGNKLSIVQAIGLGLNRLSSYLITYVITALATFIGLLMFVIPGVYILSRLLLYDFFILLEKKRPLPAISGSLRTTRPARRLMLGGLLLFIFTSLLMLGVIEYAAADIPPQFSGYVYSPFFWILAMFFTVFRYRCFLLLFNNSTNNSTNKTNKAT